MHFLPAIPIERFRFEERVPGGWNWSHVLKRETTLRITNLEGHANVSMLMYNAEFPGERLNIPDSLKAQHTAFFTAGCVCMSDHGRVLASVTSDTCGWHDALTGVSHRAGTAKKFGGAGYAEASNKWPRNGYDSLLVELGKWGLGERDIVANINFFTKVSTDEEGIFHYHENHSRVGEQVELRAEMNTLVVMNTCPHPLDPESAYRPGEILLEVYSSDPPGAEDLCRCSCDQNRRAFHNTERYFL